ncbi:MAG: hypothetical protein K5637_08565 [Lachnospiraceae bacterium]|nr:hypothetical protein [Lachnospiraceae bacterium]
MLFSNYWKKVNSYKETAGGGYSYTGIRYHWDEEAGPQRKSALKLFWILSVGALALNIIAGCMPAPGMMNAWYVIVPYAIGIICAVLTIFSVYNLANEHDPVRGNVYTSSISPLGARARAGTVFSIASAAAEVIFMIIGWDRSGIVWIILFMALQIASAYLQIRTTRLYKTIIWVKS